MKKNNHGFTLIETLLVSTFVVGTLVYLFVQFSNIKRTYDIGFQRDSIPELYYVQNLAIYLERTNTTAIDEEFNTKEYVEIESCPFVTPNLYCKQLMQLSKVKKAIIVKDDLTSLKTYLNTLQENPFSETMYQYIQDLSTPKINKKRLIVEFTNGTVASLHIK